MGQPSGVV